MRPSAFWRACAERRPDLVLLDLMLPEEDGISILKKLRQAPETARLPILLLTAKSSEYDKVLGLDSGADDYVAKLRHDGAAGKGEGTAAPHGAGRERGGLSPWHAFCE